jgi:hypothetical protein
MDLMEVSLRVGDGRTATVLCYLAGINFSIVNIWDSSIRGCLMVFISDRFVTAINEVKDKEDRCKLLAPVNCFYPVYKILLSSGFLFLAMLEGNRGPF